MKIDLCFQGWIRGLEIDSVYDSQDGVDKTVETIVQQSGEQHLLDGLRSCRYGVNCMAEAFQFVNADDTNLELSDIDKTKM